MRIASAGESDLGGGGELVGVLHDDKSVGVGDSEVAGNGVAGGLGQNNGAVAEIVVGPV